MLAYLDLRVAVNTAQSYAVHASIYNAAQRRATLAAEPQTGSMRSDVRRQKVLSRLPTELSRINQRVSRGLRTERFAATRTMT